jgi:hypothetical protein
MRLGKSSIRSSELDENPFAQDLRRGWLGDAGQVHAASRTVTAQRV